MNMTMLNPENKTLFNHLIVNSQYALSNALPQKVTISLPDDYDHRVDGCVSCSVEVDEDTRLAYVKTYVDELDTFGDDLLGHPLSDIFATCVQPKELQALERMEHMTPMAQYIYTAIWNRAYYKLTQAVQKDIVYDATKNFENSDVLYHKAYQSYYNRRDNEGYTPAQYEAMEMDQYEYEQ